MIPTVKILCGDCLQLLRTLPDESVHCCVTSPPYWGLRDYKIPPTVWGGDPACEHDWQGQIDRRKGSTNGRIEMGSTLVSAGSVKTLGPGEVNDGTGTSQTRSDKSAFCSKCGAWLGCYGLEPTPELYVEHTVAIFREVRRVLRPDGTLWLNLGDSYCANGHEGGTSGGLNVTSKNGGMPRRARTSTELKPKDLCGIPWRVARALQEPYYTGRIKDERDRIWLAAIIEAEGCMFIHKRKAGTPNYSNYEKKDGTVTEYERLQDTYGVGLEVANTDKAIVERCLQIAGIGSICEQSPKVNPRRKQTIYRWNVRSNECRWIIQELYPHMVAKQLEARLVLGCPSSGPDAEKAHASIKSVHQGGQPIIDFAAPKTLFEPGWYLRQDIIWSKPNCMPESVTDRCTKAHEYIFLLAKNATYFYDAEAIKEAQAKEEGSISVKSFAYEDANSDPKGGGYRGDGGLAGRVNNGTRNRRSVWTVPSFAFPNAHFATYPPDLIKPCILAGTSAKGCCPKCGAPWERVVEKQTTWKDRKANGEPMRYGTQNDCPALNGTAAETKTLGWRSTCTCDDPQTIPCTVIDPFFGSGTSGEVSLECGRNCIGIDLKPEYVKLAQDRCNITPGFLLA